MPTDEELNKIKEETDKIAYQKKYEDILAELGRQSERRTQASLNNQQLGIKKVTNKFYQRVEQFNKTLEHNYRTLGTESIAALILEMANSLRAFDEMTSAYKSMLIRKAWLFISKSINYSSFPPLMKIAEKIREMRINLDQNYGTEGHFKDIPALVVPYLAEVDANGQLSVNLLAYGEVKERSSQELHNNFVNKYQPIFQADVVNWLTNAVDADGYPFFEIRPGNILYHARRDADNDRPDGIVSQREFHLFREASLSPHLEASFGIKFQAKPSDAPVDHEEEIPAPVPRPRG